MSGIKQLLPDGPIRCSPDRGVIGERLHWSLGNAQAAHDWLLHAGRPLTPREVEIVEQIESELQHLRKMGHG